MLYGVARDGHCSSALHQHREDQANWTLPQNGDHVTWLEVKQFHALQTRVDRLYPTGPIEGHSFGNELHSTFHDPVHHAHILRKTAARRFKPGRDADFLVNGTLRIKPPAAVKTIAARNMMERNHPISGSEASNARSSGSDNAGRLMPENSRCWEQIVFNLFEIRMANAAALDTNQQFARANLRSGNVLYRNATVPDIHCGLHLLRYVLIRPKSYLAPA